MSGRSPSQRQAVDPWQDRAEHLIYTLSTLIDSRGFLVAKADEFGQVSSAIAGFEKLISSSIENKVKYEQIYLDLKDKLSTAKALHIRCPSVPEKLDFFSISYFLSIQELSLDMCPPSAVSGIYSLRSKMRIMNIKNSGITSLQKIFAPVSKKILRKLTPMVFNDTSISIPLEQQWSSLVILKLSNCGLAKIDESLHFFPNIQLLDLSRNSISYIIHLQDCVCLKYLDLSHNRIRVLSNLERVVGSLARLDVSHNRIESLDGIDKIYSLERVSFAANLLNDFEEVAHISKLPNLETIELSGNPFAEHKKYRLKVYTQLIISGTIMQSNRRFPTLDGKVFSKRIARKLRRIMFRAPEDSQREYSHADAQYLNRDTEAAIAMSDEDDDYDDDYNTEEATSEGDAEWLPPPEESPFRRAQGGGAGGGGGGGGGGVGTPDSVRGAVLSSPMNPNSSRSSAVSRQSLSSSQHRQPSSHKVASSTAAFHEEESDDNSAGEEYEEEDEDGLGEIGAFNRESFRGRDSIGGGGGGSTRSYSTASRSRQHSRNSYSNSFMMSTVVFAPFKCKARQRPKRSADIRDSNYVERVLPLPEVEAQLLARRAREEKERKEKEERERKRRIEEEKAAAERAAKALRLQMVEAAAAAEAAALAAAAAEAAEVEAATYKNYHSEDHVSDTTFASNGMLSPNVLAKKVQEEKQHMVSDDGGRNSQKDNSTPPRTPSREPSVNPSVSGIPARSISDGTLATSPPTSTDAGDGVLSNSLRDMHLESTASSPARKAQGGAATSSATNSPVGRRGKVLAASPPETPKGGSIQNGTALALGATAPVSVTAAESEKEAPAPVAVRPEPHDKLYVGDEEYKGLSVMENLELYFREQVFAADRPMGSGPYMKSATSDLMLPGQLYGMTAATGPRQQERFVTLFSERLVDISRGDFPSLSALLAVVDGVGAAGKEPSTSSSSSSSSSVRFRDDSLRSFGGRSSLGAVDNSSALVAAVAHGEPDSHQNQKLLDAEQKRSELKAIIVLTDMHMYLVQMDAQSLKSSFVDAPFPVVLKYHPLTSLCNCTIYFGFQRCVLGFSEHSVEIFDPSSATGGTWRGGLSPGATSSSLMENEEEVPVHLYIVLTREKVRTYPIITRVPQLANAVRSALKPIPRPNVKIGNMDAQLIECVTAHVHNLGTDHDIVHYQMGHQLVGKNNSEHVPRTVILTQSLALLCYEDLSSVTVKLKILDSAALKDVSRIYVKDDPRNVTFKFKGSSLFSGTRTWRMSLESNSAASKLLDEGRRACADVGNPI